MNHPILVETNNDMNGFLSKAKFLIRQLPFYNKSLLATLMEFLKKANEHSSENGLTMDALVMLFGPALMRPHPKIIITKEEKQKTEESVHSLIKIFLQEHEMLFEVYMYICIYV